MYTCAIPPCDKDCMRTFRIVKYSGPNFSLLKQRARKIHCQLIYVPGLLFLVITHRSVEGGLTRCQAPCFQQNDVHFTAQGPTYHHKQLVFYNWKTHLTHAYSLLIII